MSKVELVPEIAVADKNIGPPSWKVELFERAFSVSERSKFSNSRPPSVIVVAEFTDALVAVCETVKAVLLATEIWYELKSKLYPPEKNPNVEGIVLSKYPLAVETNMPPKYT